MKNKSLLGISMTAALFLSAATAMGAENTVDIYINDMPIAASAYGNTLPYMENTVTFVPIRAVAEELGYTVTWDVQNKTVTLQGKNQILLTMDSSTAQVNGKAVTLDASPSVKNNRMFVPLTFLSQYMDADISQNTQSDTVQTNKNNSSMNSRFAMGSQGDRQPIVETDAEILSVIEEGVQKFEQLTFDDPVTGISLEYSLYVPHDYDQTQSYPLLMYIPDASAASKSAEEIVAQYYGANIWVTDEEQSKHSAFVLVPAFSEIVVDDNWNTSQEIETAVNLIQHLTQHYNIDTNRLYTTGQSMGCMTSLYLNGKYPELFAASLFVSGQWDISQLDSLKNAKFFYITAGGDEKASGGQDDVIAMLEADNVAYSYSSWSAQLSQAEQNELAQELISQSCAANLIRFETGTVLTAGSKMEHNASFNYGYKIPAVRDWLFAQSK